MIVIALRDAVRYLSERLMGFYTHMDASLRFVLAHFSKKVFAGVTAFLRPSTSKISKRYSILSFLVFYLSG